MVTPDVKLSEAIREVRRLEDNTFHCRNGHVFFGVDSRDDLGFSLSTALVVRDASNPAELCASLNNVIATDRNRLIAIAKGAAADARRQMLGLFDEDGNMLMAQSA